jgi:opine dehydrogenase
VDEPLNVVIIGTGNAASAHAAILSTAGRTVTMLKTTAGSTPHYEAVHRAGGLNVLERGAAAFAPVSVTRDPSVLRSADLAILLTTTNAHESVARLIAPHAQRLPALLVIPGLLGSAVFRAALPHTLVAEGESTPVDARITRAGRVEILYRNTRNAIAANPSTRSPEALALLRAVIPTIVGQRRNVVDSALHNPNLVVHTIGVIMSAARIERARGEFWMYREAFTPSVWRLANALDAEKMRVLQAFGCDPVPYEDAARYRNAPDLTTSPTDSFHAYASDGSPKGPDRVDTRYVTEDVPMALGLLADLARIAGTPAPVTHSLIIIAGALLGRDFHAEARTAASLGLPDSVPGILDRIT